MRQFSLLLSALIICVSTGWLHGQILSETLRTGSLPAGWSQTSVTFETTAGGYANFTMPSAILTSPVIDLTGYTNVTLSYSVAKFGSGGDGPLTIEVSNDGGATWTAQTFNSSIPTNSTYINDGPTAITATGNNVRIRFIRTSSPSQKRLRDVVLNGTIPGSCDITSISIDPLSISTCDDNDTPLSSGDDFFTANVTVNYENPPAMGTLDLSGDNIGGLSSVGVGLIGTTSYTFVGVQFAADGGAIAISAAFSDDGDCALSNPNAGTAPPSCSVVPNCALPFFSEYVEGSGNNKCLEIYNPTASAIDLAAGGYQIIMYFNGSSSIGLTLNLTGVIQPGDVYVVCNTGSSADFTAQADQLGGGGWFNGNDAVVLRNTNGVLDVIGQIGMPFPPTNWSNSGVSTSEQTLRRYSYIQKGDNNSSDTFDPSLEWQAYPQNTIWGLGYHASACQPSLPGGWNPFNVGCPTGTITHNAGQWTLTSDCYEDLSSGRDDVTLAFQELCGDGEIITRICGITGLGYAGLTFRETATAGSKYIALTVQNSQNARWHIRSVTGVATQFQQKPRGGRNWLRVTRTGSTFKGYLSYDGTNWALLFQSTLPMAECMLVGLVTESNVDGTTTTANFCNVTLNNPNNLARPFDNGPVQMNEQLSHQDDTDGLALPEGTELFDSNEDGGELSIRPNPVVNELEVVLPDHLQPGALLHLVDLNGKKLFSERIGEGANLMRLNLAQLNLSAGVYLLHIQDGATVLTKRFVKVN